jgi:hypothetical protein
MPSGKLSEIELGETFECKGMWWLPQHANPPNEAHERLYGTLKYSPGEGIILTTLGAFESIDEIMATFSSDRTSNLEIVLGLSSKGERITLLNCSQAGVTIGDVVESSYRANIVLVGHQFTDPTEVTFEALDIQYTHLSEWARFDVFEIPEAWGSKEHQERIIRYKQPERVPPAIVDKYAISVVPSASLSLARFPSNIVTVEQSNRIHVEPTSLEQITLAECFELVFNMQGFLSLMMLEGIFPLVVEGTKHDKDSMQRVRVLYERVGGQKPASKLRPQDIPFAFQTIKGNFNLLLENFFKDPRMRPVYNQFFSDFYNPPRYNEERFITMSTTAEAFHRRICQEDKKNAAAHVNALNELLSDWIDKIKPASGLAEELKSRLLASYEVPFKMRMQQLLARYGKPFINAIVREENVETFLNDIVTTREYYLTYDENLEEALKGYALYVLYSKLKLLCWVIFLNHIGMSAKTIEESLEAQSRDQTSRFGFVRQLHRQRQQTTQ